MTTFDKIVESNVTSYIMLSLALLCLLFELFMGVILIFG